MTVEEIARQAAVLCGVELDAGSEGRLDGRYRRLENAVVGGLMEVARVLRRKKTETLTAAGGLIPFHLFSHGVVDVTEVRRGSERLPWSEREDGIFIGTDGEAEVTYVPCQKQVRSGDTPMIPDEVFCHRNYAYYAAAEFLSSDGRHTDARSFDVRWRRSLYSGRGRMRTPYGGWV